MRKLILFVVLFINSTLVLTAQSIYQPQQHSFQVPHKTILYVKNDQKKDVTFLIKSEPNSSLKSHGKVAKAGPWGVVSVPAQTSYIKLEIPENIIGKKGMLYAIDSIWLSPYSGLLQSISGGKTYVIHFLKAAGIQSQRNYTIHEVESGAFIEKDVVSIPFQQVHPYSLMNNFSIYAPSAELTACS